MLKASSVNCRRCPLACKRKSIVDGTGSHTSRLMVVDAWPGRDEDKAGMPQLGEGGRLLRSVVTECCNRLGVDASLVFYTYAVRCKPAYGHEVTDAELESCLPWLLAEILEIRPRHILSLGKVAAQQVATVSMELMHGYTDAYEPELDRTEAYSPLYILKNKSKLGAWGDQIEAAVRQAFGLSSVTSTTCKETTTPWTFGSPDMTSRWLSADTEFDNLMEDGSFGQRMVGYSLSDGERSDFYPVQDLDWEYRGGWLRSGDGELQELASSSTGLDDGQRPNSGTPTESSVRCAGVLCSGSSVPRDAEAEHSGCDEPWPLCPCEYAGDSTSGTPPSNSGADSRDPDPSGRKAAITRARVRRVTDDNLAGTSRSGPMLGGRHVYVHNAKADLENLGIDPDDLDAYDDTMLMAYVTRRFPRVGLKVIGPLLTGIEW